MTLTVDLEYLTVAETAALWRCSVPTIYRKVQAGRIPHIRIGGDGPIRIPAAALLGKTPAVSAAHPSRSGQSTAPAPAGPDQKGAR